MGWLTGLGTAIGLIGNNETASDIAKDMSSGLDMMFYTDEEEAIDKAKMTVQTTEAWLRMVELMKDTEKYRSITRRFLAIGIIFNLLSMIWLCVWAEVASTMGWIEIVATVGSDELVGAFTPITLSVLKLAGTFQLGWVFCTIIVFYFGPQLVQMMTGGKKK